MLGRDSPSLQTSPAPPTPPTSPRRSSYSAFFPHHHPSPDRSRRASSISVVSDLMDEFEPVRSGWSALTIALLLIGFSVCTFILPTTESFFKYHTVHLFLVHAGVTIFAFLLTLSIHRTHRRLILAGYFTFNRSSYLYRNIPFAVTTIGNVVFLVVASLEQLSQHKATQDELKKSTLLAVRVFGAVEAVVVLIATCIYAQQIRQLNKLKPSPDIARRGGDSVNGYHPPSVGSSDTGQHGDQRASELISYLQQREADLLYQVRNLQQSALSGEAASSGSDTGALSLRAKQRELNDMTDYNRELVGKIAILEDHLARSQQDLRKSAAEVNRLRTSLREERRKNEKLTLTLEIEKEANTQAQRVIEGIRSLEVASDSDAGLRTDDYDTGYSPPRGSSLSLGSAGSRPPRP